MSKKPKKPKGVIDILKDWDDKEILLTESVFKYHIASAAHDEAYLYYETLKANIAIPESVKMSKASKDTKSPKW